jgi:hypothetical protein
MLTLALGFGLGVLATVIAGEMERRRNPDLLASIEIMSRMWRDYATECRRAALKDLN